MSKRLSKRQQRELEELEQLKAVEKQAEVPEATASKSNATDDSFTPKRDMKGEQDEVDEEDMPSSAPINAFAALGGDDEEPEDEEDEDDVAETPSKKGKKKKNKKKKKGIAAAGDVPFDGSAPATPAEASSRPSRAGKKATATETADDGMDEVDKAIAELNLKYGDAQTGVSTSGEGGPSTIATSSTLGFRQLLSVDPKNLDADAELRRFFGSKVITSAAAASKSHRAGPSSKLRYTISKPKPNYPPATSLAGLGMRELSDSEVESLRSSSLADWHDPAEKWFTFEHSGAWREITRQFLGAVQSHDPNQLMALLQVYPWHVDTLMQMSEVYRLQSDIGAASDYAERALYALDRCLSPAFNVSSGACRLDFTRVENRPMFMALHRIISYLGRRGCWSTAFNFAKLLFSIDPMGDPHGAAFWLDFLAIKSGSYAWILSMFETQSEQLPSAVFQGYPGMAFAYALACRAREDAEKCKDRVRSDNALREAILGFPQAIIPLAEKIGASIPDNLRGDPLCRIQVGYSDDPNCPIHLLSHIYAARSEALWKDPSILSWFEKSIPLNIPDLNRPDAIESREDVLRLIHTPRDPFDEQCNIPLFICRHVLCSESTSFVGFLPSLVTNRSFNAYDPLPPLTAISSYNHDYFAGLRPSRTRGMGGGMGTGAGGTPAALREWAATVLRAADEDPAGWRGALMDRWRGMMGMQGGVGQGGQGGGDEREQHLAEMLRLAEQVVEDLGQDREGQQDGGDMPGAFPQ